MTNEFFWRTHPTEIPQTVNPVQHFYDHVADLLKYRIKGHINDLAHLEMDEKTYHSISQYAKENAHLLEKNDQPFPIDWTTIDKKVNLARTLITDGWEDIYAPFIEFTLETYENLLIHACQYRTSCVNPYKKLYVPIFKEGCLYLATDNENLINQFGNNDLLGHPCTDHKLCVMVAFRNKTLGCYRFDNRFNIMGKVLEYLTPFADGKDIGEICHFVQGQGIQIDESKLAMDILGTLKNMGTITSDSKNRYYTIV